MSSTQGLHSLATIIKRLEAATSRLEDITTAQATGTVPKGVAASASAAPSSPAPVVVEPVEEAKSVLVFTEVIIQGKVDPFVQNSAAIGGVVHEQAKLVSTLFADLHSLILQASLCRKPKDADLPKVLEPLSNGIAAIGKIKDDNRSSKENRDLFNHLSAVADGAQAVTWVIADPKPAPVVGDAKDSAEFFANRVRQAFKDKDEKHVVWAKSYIAILEELRKYVFEYHTTGLVWNPRGQDPTTYKSGAPAAAAAGGPPPPPPPPPPTDFNAAPAAGGVGAVFAALNQGESVTKGLKKVSPEEQTHKNPALRASSVVPATSQAPSAPLKRPAKPSKPPSLAGKKPGKIETEGSKWLVEYQENEKNIVLDAADQRSVVVNIFGCKNSVIQIKGKINAVTLVNCQKTSVLVESVIASISVTSSPSFALQILGSVPTIQLDSTDSGQIYLSKECLGIEITTAKCSSINVSLPDGDEEGVFVERAIPEMLRTVVSEGGKELTTTIVEHSG